MQPKIIRTMPKNFFFLFFSSRELAKIKLPTKIIIVDSVKYFISNSILIFYVIYFMSNNCKLFIFSIILFLSLLVKLTPKKNFLGVNFLIIQLMSKYRSYSGAFNLIFSSIPVGSPFLAFSNILAKYSLVASSQDASDI